MVKDKETEAMTEALRRQAREWRETAGLAPLPKRISAWARFWMYARATFFSVKHKVFARSKVPCPAAGWQGPEPVTLAVDTDALAQEVEKARRNLADKRPAWGRRMSEFFKQAAIGDPKAPFETRPVSRQTDEPDAQDFVTLEAARKAKIKERTASLPFECEIPIYIKKDDCEKPSTEGTFTIELNAASVALLSDLINTAVSTTIGELLNMALDVLDILNEGGWERDTKVEAMDVETSK